MTQAAGAACFHCGEPIPAGIVIRAHIATREEPVCCHGCRAVAEFITGAGLDDSTVIVMRPPRAPTNRRDPTDGPPTIVQSSSSG